MGRSTPSLDWYVFFYQLSISKVIIRLSNYQLEYAAAAWSPHTAQNIYSLESVQRQAVRYICEVYDRTTSITPLLTQLNLDQLNTRRLLHQCTMCYKIHHNIVNISFPPSIQLHPAIGRTRHQLVSGAYRILVPMPN